MSRRQSLGFTLVELLVVIAVIGILIALLIPAVQSVREAARKTDCMSRIRQIGIATSMFYDTNKAFPPGRLYPKMFPVPPYAHGYDEPSWLVRILPYIEQVDFYSQWDLSGSFNDHPEDLTTRAVQVYLCPSRRSVHDAEAPGGKKDVLIRAPCGCGGWIQIDVVGGATGDYAGNHGDLSPGSFGAPTDFYYGGNGTGVIISSRAIMEAGGTLKWVDRIKFSSIRDGTSNTFLAGELHVTQGKLNTIPFNGPIYNGNDLAAFCRVGGPGVPILSQHKEPVSSVLGFGSWHSSVCNFVFADVSTRSISNNIDTVTLGQLCNRNDGETPFLDH